MTFTPFSAYVLWTALCTALVKFMLSGLTDLNPGFFASLLTVVFIQVSIVFPIAALVSKNENS